MPAPVIPDATFPIPPPVAHLPIVQPGNGTFTPVGLELFTKIWAAIQGGGGVYPSIQVLQQEVATIFAMHGDGTLSSDGVLTVTKTQGVPFGPYATATSLPIATVASVGVVKPDGTTITIDPDGTIHSAGGAISITGTDGNLVFTPDPITGAGDIDFAPNINVTGYLNVGSVGPPTNTTAGDVTGLRLSVGNLPFNAGNGLYGSLTGTLTSTTAGNNTGIGIVNTLSPTGNSGSQFRVFSLSNQFSAAGINFTATDFNVAGYFENRVFNAGTIGTGVLEAIQANGLILAGSAVSCGNVANVQAIHATPFSSFGNALTPTITKAVAFEAQNSAKGTATITGQAGFVSEGMTAGTNNVDFLAGTATIPTGNWGFYQSDTKNNAFAGNVRIGSVTAPAHTLDVTGNQTVSGYLRVGSNTSPTNTTAGDLTALRFFLGTLGLIGTPGQMVDAGYTPAAWAAATTVAITMNALAPADAGGTSDARLLVFNNTINGTANAASMVGIQGDGIWASTGTVNTVAGSSTSARSTGGGTVTAAYAVGGIVIVSGAGSVITEGRALYARSPSASTGAIMTAIGLRIDGQKNGANVTKGYGVNQVSTADLNVFAGATTIGAAADPTASAVLDLNSTTGALLIPRMTTTQRLALTPSNGMEVYDTTVGAFFDFTAGAWVQRGSGGGGGGYSPGTVPTVVQVAFSVNGGNSATFANPPTNGNLLVAMSFNPTSNVVGTGWTRQTSNGTGTDFGNVLTKVAGAGESATQSPMSGISTTGGMVIWEIAGQNATTPYIFGISQSEQTAASNTPLLAPNLTNGLGLSCVALVTTPTIVLAANLGTQDILDNSGTRKLAAGHTDLSKTPMVGVVSTFSASGNSKGATCIISS